MPLVLLFIGLILTIVGAVRLSPFWAVTTTQPSVAAFATLLAGLIALAMVIPWMVVRGITGLQTTMTDDLPEPRSR
jgi:hypothetical protein